MKYKFFADAGHGWLKVPTIELINLKIAHKITPYSYQKGDFTYLEEDCDLTCFEQKKKERNESLEYKEHVCLQRQSRIRTYDWYALNNCEYLELKYKQRLITSCKKDDLYFVTKQGLPDTDQLFLECTANFRYKRNIAKEINFNAGMRNMFCFSKL